MYPSLYFCLLYIHWTDSSSVFVVSCTSEGSDVPPGDVVPDEDRMDEDEIPAVPNDPNDLSQYNMDKYDEEDSGGIGE